MGSGTKKHKRDRDSKKHKHRSRSKSEQYISDVEIIEDNSEKESSNSSKHRHHRRRHQHQSSTSSSVNKYKSTRSRSKSRSRSPIGGSGITIANSKIPSSRYNDDDYETKLKEYERERRYAHKRHKEHKHKHRGRSPDLDRNSERGRERSSIKPMAHSHTLGRVDDYHSDSSDVVEVPIAPPAPIISKRKSPLRTKSPSPIPENGAGDCLSIEETNKLRAKLGLKPLEIETKSSVPAPPSISGKETNDSGLNSFKDEWGEFLHKPAHNIAEKTEAKKLREKLKERKEKRALEEKLKRVKCLGESDDEVDNVKKWIERSKQKDELRKEAERREKMLEEMDQEFGVDNLVEQELKKTKEKVYKDRDLKGLRVEHDFGDFNEGKQIILTLKDKDVLDDNDDALVNVNLLDEERYRKNVENKKEKPDMYGYNVYEETYDLLGNPIERGILGKYDEEIQGNKKQSFVIGENLDEEREHKRRVLEIRTKLAGKRLETLDDSLVKLASDTYTEPELEKFKKPKRKIKKLRQKLRAEDLISITNTASKNNDLGSRRNRNNTTVTSTANKTRAVTLQTDDTPDIKEDLSKIKIEVDDEDELQRVLSKARKLKQKENIIRKPLPINPTEIKPEIKKETESDDEMNGEQKDGNIILNATAEFCRTLGDIPTYGMAGNREEDSNDMMNFENEVEFEAVKDEPIANTGTWNSVNPDLVTRVLSGDENSQEVSDIAILDEEPDVGSGVAAALQLAMSKGYLEKDDTNRPSNSRMAHLQAKNYSIEDKSYAEEEKFGRRDRYHTGPIMDFKEKDTFKPNVKLEYIDDNGRVLNAKEAFRYLSHKFHGKGPGKNKIEKRLKKMEQEGLMKKMSSTDTPLGTLSMLRQKQKETHAPYVVLSGNKQLQTDTSIAKHK